MGIQGLPQLPIDDKALELLTTVTAASVAGDADALRSAIEDWGSVLTPTKKAEFEQMISLIMTPTLPPAQLFAIFSNPEESMGILRLASSAPSDMDFLNMLHDATTSSIVLAGLTNWAQSTQNIATAATDQAVKDQITAGQKNSISATSAPDGTPQVGVPTSTPITNPVDQLLAAYVAANLSKGIVADPTLATSTTQTMQFLRNNPILTSSLQVANPSLAWQAYQIAEAQIVLSCLDRIIETQAVLHQAQVDADRKREIAGTTPKQQLLNDIHHEITTGTTPLAQSTFMIMQLLLVSAVPFQVAAINATATTATTGAALTDAGLVANLTTLSTGAAGLAAAKTYFPGDEVAASVLVSLPALYDDRSQDLSSTKLLTELGQLSSSAIQMVPYWTMPAAITFQQAAATVVGPKSGLESAVRAFVTGVVALVNDPAFAILLQNTILRNAPDASKVSPEQLKAYVAAIKIALLANALVALYKFYLSKSTDEIAKLFNTTLNEAAKLVFNPRVLADKVLGKSSLTGTPLFEELVKMIKEFANDIPEDKRETFIRNLFEGFSADTPLETLIDPSAQFLTLFEHIGTADQQA